MAPASELDVVRAELDLVRAELEDAYKKREVLLASVAHDLRNPLNTFAMSVGLLRDDFEHESVDRARALGLVQRMERAAARMQSLIDDLVEASRIDAKKIDLRPRPESAATVVREAVDAAKPVVVERGASIAELEVDPSIRANVDRTRAAQALHKAIAFALRSAGEGGVLEVGATSTAHGVVFHVTAKTPSGTAPQGPPDEGRGGLPLLIARGLAEAHGGKLHLDVSRGLTVTITVPVG